MSSKQFKLENRMLISAENITIPNIKQNKVSKPLITAHENESLHDLKILDYLSHSSNSINGQLISFQAKKKTVNGDSRDFTKNHYFPAHKKVPDGFKIDEERSLNHKYTIDSRGRILFKPDTNQVTTVDRKKDEALREILEEYENKVSAWQKEFVKINPNRFQNWREQFKKKTERKNCKQDWKTFLSHKPDWQTFLINKTTRFVKSYSELPMEEAEKGLEMLEGEETYLGEIMEAGFGICRHNSFLFKLLMETQSIPVACQTGIYMDTDKPYHSMFDVHMWNVIKKGNSPHIQDVSLGIKDESRYLSLEYDPLYTNKSRPLFLEEKFEQDILDMQPGQAIRIGLDKKGNLVTDKMNPKAEFFYEFSWTKEDKFELNKLKNITGKRFILNYSKKLHSGLSIYDTDTRYTIKASTIRANLARRVMKIIDQIERKFKINPLDTELKQLIILSKKLDSEAPKILINFSKLLH